MSNSEVNAYPIDFSVEQLSHSEVVQTLCTFLTTTPEILIKTCYSTREKCRE